MRERSEDEIRFKAIRIYEETGRFGYAVHEADVRGGKAPASRTQAGPGQAKTQTPEVLSAPGSSLAGLQGPVAALLTRETIADDKSGKIHVAQNRKYSCCLDTHFFP